MAPKKKEKSLQSNWIQCSLCGKLFVTQDAELHSTSCDADHGYIQKKVFFGKVMNVEGILKKDGTQLMKSVRDYNSVIWLAIPTMQICGFSIGQPCVVNRTIVKRAWPSETQSCSIAAISAECMKSINVKKGETVAISRFVWKGSIASVVELTLRDQNPLFETEEFCNFVSAYLDKKYITEGTPLIIHYFGALCHCQVSSICEQVNTEGPSNPSQSTQLEEMLGSITISGQNQSLCTNAAEDSVLGAGDASLSMNISNASLDESALSLHSVSQNQSLYCDDADNSVLGTDDASFMSSQNDVQDAPSGPNFYRVSSTVTKFFVIQDSLNKAQDTECNISLKDVGGLTNQIADIKNSILTAQAGYITKCCILLNGPQGTGKSLLVKALTNDLGLPTFHLVAADLWSKHFGEAESKLRKTFQMAQARSPSIVVLDNLDMMCPTRSPNTIGQPEHRLIGTLINVIDNLVLSRKSFPVFVIGVTNKKHDIDTALRRAGRFGYEVEVAVPSARERLEILQLMMDKVSHELTAEQLETVARNAHGYVGADLQALIDEAILLAKSKQDPKSPLYRLSIDDLVRAGDVIKPSALREVQLQVTEVRWSDIGGMSEVKMRLLEAVEIPLTQPEIYKRMGITPPKGLLMYGPPGCSKTMIAKALATECHLNFLAVKGPEIFKQYVGESEKAIRDIFSKARSASPAVIFFDEIDAIASKRGSSGGSGVDDRVLTQLLTEMDGLEFLKDVFVLAATNRPDKIDGALLRPGRFDSLVYVPLPDNATRKEIIDKKISSMPISEDVQLEWLVEQTTDYSGAEIIQVCQEAAICAVLDGLQDKPVAKPIEKKHFELALNKVQPRIDEELLQIYKRFNSKK